ncbi:MAG: hypothetical protein IJE45_04805 [Bacilli bacterium]|nr:hypothetical protein [Bacilli bacterium]
MVDDNFPYKHILNEEHRKSAKHQPLPISSRAAQFSPFAALVGYDEMVSETARRTDKRIELDEYDIEELNRKINMLQDHLYDDIEVNIKYFVPDERKEGGKYVEVSGIVDKIRDYEKDIILEGERIIPIREIIEIESDLFNHIEE